MESNLSTLTPRSQTVRSAVAVSKTLTYDDRVRRWRLENPRRRRRRCERASKPSHAARSICAQLYARCAEVQPLYGIAGTEGPASATSESAIKPVVSSDSCRVDVLVTSEASPCAIAGGRGVESAKEQLLLMEVPKRCCGNQSQRPSLRDRW